MSDDSEVVPGVKLIVGLGNPGSEYEGTRHNIGFAVLDALARKLGLRWEKSSKWDVQWAKDGETLLVKPWSFMNRSGLPLATIANFYKILPAQMLIVVDDTALPVGRLRVRPDGSSGGHHGLDSIFMHSGTDAIPRLRVGIGSPPPEGGIDYVLGRFFEEEKPAIEKAVIRAVEAVQCAVDKGVVSAMNTFNKFPEP